MTRGTRWSADSVLAATDAGNTVRTRQEIEADIAAAAAQANIVCVVATLAIEVVLDIRDLLEAIRDNTDQS